MFKKAKYYNDCSELKAATFFKILKTGDKTLLCYSGKPKQKELDSIWESIETEYEQKTATPQYIYKIAESNNDCLNIIRNNGLILLYWKKKLAPDRDWSNDEKYWDVEGYDANGIYAIILQERTRFNIRKIQEQEIKELKDKSQKPITIERLKHYVELGLEKDYIDFEKISVLEWLDLCALYSERAEAIKNSPR
jgi:hypothetical protein